MKLTERVIETISRGADGKSNPPNPVELVRLLRACHTALTAAEALLWRIENMTTDEFAHGGERLERERLALLLGVNQKGK